MSLFSWFKNEKKNPDVKVVKVKEESVDIGSMAASSPSAASEQLSRMMEQQRLPIKILVTGTGSYSAKLTDYSLKMAQRLDCSIVVLDVTDEPLRHSGDRRKQEEERFIARSKDSITSFSKKAEAMSIDFSHFTKIEEPEKAIAQLSNEDAGIRYVLTEPEESATAEGREEAHIPVFDIACSRL